jgi:hypothetical protein
VGAVVVVLVEVVLKVVAEGATSWDERAREGRAPALLEDGQLDAFDTAVAVGPAGADEALARSELGDGLAEVAGAELRPVVGT